MYKKIKAYLEEKGIKQKIVAQKMSISENTMCAILAGTRRLTAEEYLNLCEILNVTPGTFWKGEK